MADTTKFSMLGARAAIEIGLIHIEAQVAALETAVAENPALAFDLARAIVESTCRSILADRSVPFSPEDELPKLLNAVTNILPFLPSGASSATEARKSLSQTINGLKTAVQGVSALRNVCGFASHGSDGPKPVLETAQAILAAGAADAIVGFLYRVHRQDGIRDQAPLLSYDTNSGFNGYIDDLHAPVRIFDEDFFASRILFELAPQPYRLYLAEYNQQASDPDEEQPTLGQVAPAVIESERAVDETIL
jgi:hypothetical protein